MIFIKFYLLVSSIACANLDYLMLVKIFTVKKEKTLSLQWLSRLVAVRIGALFLHTRSRNVRSLMSIRFLFLSFFPFVFLVSASICCFIFPVKGSVAGMATFHSPHQATSEKKKREGRHYPLHKTLGLMP